MFRKARITKNDISITYHLIDIMYLFLSTPIYNLGMPHSKIKVKTIDFCGDFLY